MAKSCFLWKSSWKNLRNDGGIMLEKYEGVSISLCSGCSVWWKIVRFWGMVFGFWEKMVDYGPGNDRNKIDSFSEISTTST